jgi:AraC-like DNA-binding protein
MHILNKSEVESNPNQTVGILDSHHALQQYSLKRYDPSGALATFVEQYWIVRWDLPAGQTYETKILPFPSVNMAITNTESTLNGVVTGTFSRTLHGKGTVIGVKFLPGGFHPFYKKPIERLTNQVLPLKTIFPAARIKKIVSQLDQPDNLLIQEVEKLLLTKHPEHDPTIAAIGQIITTVKDDPTIWQVQTISEAFSVSERTIQYAFKNYVGIGLKAVISRYRLQDAANAIDHGHKDWASLAQQYGFTDQPHFIREFKKVLGETPAQYSKRIHGE